MSTSLPPPEHRSLLPSLSGLRWLAAGLVFAFHVDVVGYFGGAAEHVLARVMAAGATGVGLFFVLSGFVLAWSAEDRVRARTFYRRRFARVWPAHAALVVVAVVVTALVTVVRPPGQQLPGVTANLFLVSAWVPHWSQAGNPVAWSLVCEAFFYAGFPLLWRLIRRVCTVQQWVLSAAAAYAAVWCAPALLVLTGITATATQASYHPLARWPEFALGVIAAGAMRAGVWRGVRLRVGVTAAAVTYVLATELPGLRAVDAAVTAAGSVLLVAALARADRDGVRTRLAGRVSVHLGEVSFAFYLCHLLVLGVLGAAWPGGHPDLAVVPAVGLTVLAAGVSLGGAELTHRGVERPARRWLLERDPRHTRTRNGGPDGSGVQDRSVWSPAVHPFGAPGTRGPSSPARSATGSPEHPRAGTGDPTGSDLLVAPTG